MSPNQNNPYARAAGAYDLNARKNTGNQRELEGRVLLKANRMLQDLQNDWESVNQEVLQETLKYNRQIWMLFYDTALENPEGDRPNDLRSNIVNLANFIFKREMEILGDPQKEKLDILININREVAAGLMSMPAAAQSESENPAAATSSQTDVQG